MSKFDYVFLSLCLYNFVLMPYYVYLAHVCLCTFVIYISTTYMSQTRDQQHFTISEMAADWHEPVVLQRIMWPSIAHANGQLDPRCS